jgi:hypothetical protein
MRKPIRASLGLIACLSVAFVACGKRPAPRFNQTPPRPAATPTSRPALIDLGSKDSGLFELTEAAASISPVSGTGPGMSPSAALSSWQRSFFVAGVESLGDSLYAVVNRLGVVEIQARGASVQARVFRAARFADLVVLSVFSRSGKLYAFLTPEDPFAEGTPAAGLVSFDPQTGNFAEESLAFRQSYGDEWKILYCAPLGDGSESDKGELLVQLNHKEGRNMEEGYLRLNLGSGAFIPMKRSAYLAALEPRRIKLGPPLADLVRANEAIARYLTPARQKNTPYSVILQARGVGWPARKGYLLAGDGSEEWSAEINSWQSETEALALYPDGRLRFSNRVKATQEWREGVTSFPSLPATFDYSFVASSGRLVVGAWSESVFPNVGRTGLAFVRL